MPPARLPSRLRSMPRVPSRSTSSARLFIRTAADPNDNVTLSADNLVQLTATVTDKDGDHSTATLNIGQNFELP